MSKADNYKGILKATSIFGSAQLIVILITLIKSKFVAVLLGTTGYGINSLFNNPLNLILAITSLGISFSAIRNIAIAKSQKNSDLYNKTLSIYYKLLWGTGILGVITMLLLAPLLSYWSFGNYNYTIDFIILSITLLFISFSNGYIGLLKGLQLTKLAAKVTIIPPLIATIASIPLFIIFGIKGIVPALFITHFATFLISRYYAKNIQYTPIKLKIKDVLDGGKEMISLGFVMTLAGLLSQLVGYLIILLITRYGSIEEVGLYNAGFSMTTMYIGLIFSAIAADYFPRLAAICNDNIQIREVANQQGEIILILLCPIIVLFIVFLPFIIRILLSDKFLTIIPFIQLTTLGMILRAVSWSMSYIPSAKGESKLFLVMETISCIANLALSYIGYRIDGLRGLGWSFILNYVFYTIIVYIIVKHRYQFKFSGTFYKVFCITCIFCILSLLISLLKGIPFYIFNIIISIIAIIYAITELDKRIQLLSYIKKRF